MTSAAIDTTAPCCRETIVTVIVRGLAARFTSRHEAAELQRLAGLPPYLVADMGLPGFHHMTPRARKAAYRAAIRHNA